MELCGSANGVFIILTCVNSIDFTFSSGYLGLFSVLGTLIGIILCCTQKLMLVRLRSASRLAELKIMDKEVGMAESPSTV